MGSGGGKRVLIARAKQAREALPDALRAGGCEVDVVPVYETHPAPREITERLRGMLERRELDAITFTSASTVSSLCEALGDDAAALIAKSGAVVGSIGPVTSEAAAARGITVHATASTYTLEGLITALELHFTRSAAR